MLERAFGQPKFRVSCLGALKLVEAGSGTDMTPTSRKTRALIGYLCIVGKPVGRERLATLLWGDRGDEQARASLRQAVYELRSLLGGDHLLKVERDTIAVGENVATDVADMAAAAQSGNLEQLGLALSEWRGDFFEDLPSIDPSFDAWLQSERLRVQEHLVNTALEAAKAGMTRGEIEPARKIVNLLQQRDGTNEPVLRLGLRLDHLAGDSAALHRHYERFRELLRAELDAVPAAETQRLFQELTRTQAAPTGASTADDKDAGVQPVQGKNETGRAAAATPVTAQSAAAGHGISKHPSIRYGHWIRDATVILAITALCAIAWAAWNQMYKPAPPHQERLLAVLPFQNLGADRGSRYFSDGITEEIVDALLRTTTVRVASPISSFRFRNAGAAKAAKALAATDVLSGSVERAGDRIHLIAQLTDIRNNSVIWSQTYDRAIAETPALRRDIAMQIAEALDMRLSASSLDEEQHVNPAAYDHYLKGRDLYLQRNLDAAEPELDASVRLAPDFAKAWSTLAALRVIRVSYEYSERQEDDPAMEKAARAAAERALALDPNGGEALFVLAHLTPATRLTEADRLEELALRSEPNSSQLLNWRGAFLSFVGRNREAVDDLTRAYEIDRVTPSIAQNLAESLVKTGRFEEAKEIIGLAPDGKFRTAFFELRVEYLLFRRDWAALANDLGALPDFLSPSDAALFRLCRETAAALAQNAADRFGPLRARWRSAPGFDPEVTVQFLYALGDADGALAFIGSTVAKHRRNDHFLVNPGWTALFPANLSALRRDPRVPALFGQWGLFNYWRTTDHWPDFCYEPSLPFDCKAAARRYVLANGQSADKLRRDAHN